MGLFGRRGDREGAGLPLPEGGIRRYGVLLATHFWKLVELNLLFILFSIPIVTLPAALCGVNRVCVLLIRNGYCFVWGDFWEEFRRSFRRSLLPALLFALLLFVGYYAMSLGLSNAGLPDWSVLFWAVGIAASAAGICWGGYFFVLVALLDQKNKVVLKNARLLCMVNPFKAFVVLAAVAVMVFLLAALMPLGVLAQPINIDNNPNQPGYVVPSQQRMQNQMQVQQQQQQSMLKQDLNNQTRTQQQHLQNQLKTNQQRAAQGGNLNAQPQVLPNNNGGMLRQTNP